MRRIIYLVFLAFSMPALSGCAGQRQEMQGIAVEEKVVPPRWEANGIEVIRIKPAANGMMLDLRYRVTDLEKARGMIKPTTPITLVDQASGTVMPVPNMAKVGKLRNLPSSDDMQTVYWMFFNNPGAMVKKGGRVTLVIGDVRIKDIPVE